MNTADLSLRLVSLIRSYGSCAVALSGGVDSAVAARAAYLALGDRAVAITGVSSSMADGELELARHVAAVIGIRHVELATHEFQNQAYVSNPTDRCYYCKSELYDRMDQYLREAGLADWVLVNGANQDDLADYRPGMRAAHERRVHCPLAECGLGKDQVRQLAREWGLPVWDKPATPCLASRVAYGEEVLPERLRMIDAAERLLREAGFVPARVRYHAGDVARVEVAADQIGRLTAEPFRTAFAQRLTELGFRFVTVDLLGFRSGSLNALVQIATRPVAAVPGADRSCD